ncbi:hypothetical protein [Myroides odoratus]|uniref:Uncharacterized protein n=1 Tax=Myroides odoratus TaxID=256 RepID=A0A378U4W9_MYROD|nr:hypothetical protein [Myroides odoratus]QQU03232.1 hypothetical protein I6I89_15715 [Myroides odoratus]STZ69510.1 Uncharacterised protein [Myroides odoratus]
MSKLLPMILLFTFFIGCKKSDKIENVTDSVLLREQEVVLNEDQLSYKIYKSDFIEKATVSKYILEIILDSNQEVDSTKLIGLLTHLNNKALLDKKGILDIVDIKIYESEKHLKSGLGQWIGWLSKNKNIQEPRIDIKLANDVSQESIVQRIEEKQRRIIWEELIHSQDKASDEVDKKRLDFDAENALMERYRTKLKSKYGISEIELSKISAEAYAKNWPFPIKGK